MKQKRIIAMLLVICFAFAGCSEKQATTNSNDRKTIKWYIPLPEQADTNLVLEKAKEYIDEKLNVNMEFAPISFGDYETKLGVINASREEYDLSFVSNWVNFYVNNVARGSLMPITDLIKQHAPQTYKNIPEKFWKGIEIDGEIYGVINQQIMSRSPCLLVPTKNLSLLDVDFSTYNDFSDIEDYLKKAYEKSGKPTYLDGNWVQGVISLGYDEFLTAKSPAVIDYRKPDNIKVFNQYETEKFKSTIKQARKWVENGWIPPNSQATFDLDVYEATAGENDIVPRLLIYPTYKPGLEEEYKTTLGLDVTAFMIQRGLVNTYSTTSTMTGVSATSKSPESALKVVELVNTDKELYNLLCYGIENTNYTKIDENTIKPNENRSYLISNWALGNIFNGYLLEGNKKDVWEETKKLNDEGFVSPLLGFSPKLEEIKVENQNCNSAVSEYLDILVNGLNSDVDGQYEKFINKLKVAGVDKMISTLQKQIDEWNAQK